MFATKLIVYAVFTSRYFGHEKILCDHDNEECVTEAMKTIVFPIFIAGIPGKVEGSDPIHIHSIAMAGPKFKFTLRNPNLIGLKDCDAIKLKLSDDETNYIFELLCPRLVIDGELEVLGEIDDTSIQHKDHCELVYHKYYMNITGRYDKQIGEDGLQHDVISDWMIQLELQGEVTKNYQKLNLGAEILNKLEEMSRNDVMFPFIDRLMQNIKAIQEITPVKNLRFKY